MEKEQGFFGHGSPSRSKFQRHAIRALRISREGRFTQTFRANFRAQNESVPQIRFRDTRAEDNDGLLRVNEELSHYLIRMQLVAYFRLLILYIVPLIRFSVA